MTAAATAGNAPGRLLAVVKSMIVAPGLHLPGGMLKKEGLQGTMTGEAAMMTEEALTHIMTAAGTMWTGAETTAAGTRRTIGMTTGPRGTPPTETAVGRAERPWFSGWPVVRFRCGPRILPQKASWTGSRIASNMFLLYGQVPCTSSSEVIALCPSFALALPGPPEDIPPVVRMEPLRWPSFRIKMTKDLVHWRPLKSVFSGPCSRGPLVDTGSLDSRRSTRFHGWHSLIGVR